MRKSLILAVLAAGCGANQSSPLVTPERYPGPSPAPAAEQNSGNSLPVIYEGMNEDDMMSAMKASGFDVESYTQDGSAIEAFWVNPFQQGIHDHYMTITQFQPAGSKTRVVIKVVHSATTN